MRMTVASVAVAILLGLLTTVICENEPIVSFTASSVIGNLEQVVVDTESGKVYIGGPNNLYQLSKNLAFEFRAETGPKLDHPDCKPGTSCPQYTKKMLPNHSRILVINPGQYLLACGSVEQGMCTVHSLRDIHNGVVRMDASLKINYVASRAVSGNAAFFGTGPTRISEKVLYAAHTFDQRPMELSPPTLSSRILKRMGGVYKLEYVRNDVSLNSYSKIDIDYRLKDSYVVNYIYGFEHKGFNYYITNQKEDWDSQIYSTRIIRSCQNDDKYFSYLEVLLICKSPTTTESYNVAQAAYIGKAGTDLARELNIMDTDDVLYVVFGKSDIGSRDPVLTEGTALCVYDMKSVRTAFTKTQIQCSRGIGYLTYWFHAAKLQCNYDPDTLNKINDDFCAGNGVQIAMQSDARKSTTFLSKTATIRKENTTFTSVAVFPYLTKTVALFGTQDGELIKMPIQSGNPKPYAVVQISSDPSVPIQQDVAVDKTNTNLYVLSGNNVTKFPLQSCGIYTECATCVTTADPLECGWCKDKCSTRAACTSGIFTKTSCRPVVNDFEPVDGPTKGGTLLTVYGENFGANHSSVTAIVKIAQVPCDVVRREHTKILCRSRASGREVNREVEVTVTDKTRLFFPYEIEGSASSTQEFSYKEVAVQSFAPLRGVRSGGTELSVNGKNLAVGSKEPSITVANQPCKNSKVTDSVLSCATSPWQGVQRFSIGQRKRRQLTEGNVVVHIDGAEFKITAPKFSYTPDPTVEDVYPQKSILSGGMTLTVKGTYLDVVQQPKVLANIVGENPPKVYQQACRAISAERMKCSVPDLYKDLRIDSNCAIGSADRLDCPSPNISSTWQTVTPEKPLVVYISFLMDGVENLRNPKGEKPLWSRFEYYPNPIFYNFEGGLKQLYNEEEHLAIQGLHLDLALTPGQVVVTIDGQVCNVTAIGATELLCRPPHARPEKPDPNAPKMKVKVISGNLKFEVGLLQYAGERPSIVLAGALGGAAAVLVIIVVILIVFMWRKQKGPFKKKAPIENSVRYNAPTGVIQNANATENTFNMNAGANAYANALRKQMGLCASRETGLDKTDDDGTWMIIEDSKLLIPRHQLDLGEIIGQGNFGMVFKGSYIIDEEKNIVKQVAIKTTRNEFDDTGQDTQKFVNEALVMKDFNHLHVLTLIGISMDKHDHPLVVLPFMKHGDLLSYIRGEANNPTVKELIEFAIQIADGMAYLADLKFVHRDLAARNCMLDENMTLKVADFGLSRDIYERDYYSSEDKRAKLPVKWMAPESLEKSTYNHKTDVWSYGVLMWELMTRGVTPYPAIDNWDILRFLKTGRRMPQPSFCPDALYAIMINCWHPEPRERPTFHVLFEEIRDMIMSLQHRSNQKVDLDVQYINLPEEGLPSDYLYPTRSQLPPTTPPRTSTRPRIPSPKTTVV